LASTATVKRCVVAARRRRWAYEWEFIVAVRMAPDERDNDPI
jgi:hypothetical protein